MNKKAILIIVLVIAIAALGTAASALPEPTISGSVAFTPDIDFPPVVFPGDSMTVSYSINPEYADAILCLWDLAKNTRVEGTEDILSRGTGQLKYFAPISPGRYAFRLSKAGSDEVFAESGILEVKEFAPNLQVNTIPYQPGPPTLKPGELLSVLITRSSGLMHSRIYLVDLANDTEVPGYSREVLSQNEDLTFNAPETPGTYSFRITRGDNGKVVGSSNEFTVVKGQTEPTIPEPVAEPKPVTEPGEGVKYLFDEVEVTFAAEFTAIPVSAEGPGWFMDIAGGQGEPLEIMYGKVRLTTYGRPEPLDEEFIKISAKNGSERFLHNRMTTGWYDQGEGTYQKLKYIKTLFWSAKRLEDTSVVKYLDPSAKSAVLKINFDENQQVSSANLYFYREGETPGDEFWSEADPDNNIYRADMSTLNYSGDPITRLKELN